jgi:integrase
MLAERVSVQNQSKSMQLFRNRIYRKSRSQASVDSYSTFVRLFIEHLGLRDADELAEKLRSGKINVVQALNGWLDKLDKEDKAPGSQKNYYFGVKKFVEVVTPELKVNWKLVDLPRQRVVEEDRRPTREGLRIILEHGNLTDRMLGTFLSSSGVREGTLVGLCVGNVDFDTYKDVTVVKIPSEISKGRMRYVTFLTPEAKRVLQEYLEVRRRNGEQITDESPLIGRNVRTKDGELGFKPITTRAVRKRWQTLLERAGKAERARTWHKLHLHTLRKFFRTNLEQAGVSTSFRERLMGHKGEYLDDAYFKPRVEELLNEYRKAIANLTIMEQIDETQMLKRQARMQLRQLMELKILPEENIGESQKPR